MIGKSASMDGSHLPKFGPIWFRRNVTRRKIPTATVSIPIILNRVGFEINVLNFFLSGEALVDLKFDYSQRLVILVVT
jgi:hypothetical protein